LKPILYTFRRCPYAIRARLAIEYAGIDVDQREIELKNKPQPMLDVSPKGTVPVLILKDGTVIDESLDIMCWAINIHDPADWLHCKLPSSLILENDGDFKKHLDHYKYADRFPEHPVEYYRDQAELFLRKLEQLLLRNQYLAGDQPTLVDYAILPFIRQFSLVDKQWFDQAPYPAVRQWLDNHLQGELFTSVMIKQPIYEQ